MAKYPTASDMGKKGGPARAACLTPKERQDIARLGGLARAKKLKATALPEVPATKRTRVPKTKGAKASA